MNIDPTIAQTCAVVLFLCTVFLQLTNKNRSVAVAYGVQSLAVTALLFTAVQAGSSILSLVVVAATLVVKVILAPSFFFRLIKRHEVTFRASTHVNAPIALAAVGLLTAVAASSIFAPLTHIMPAHHTLLVLALASMFSSVFLMVNGKDALAQIVGVLSLENSIVVFSLLAGLEQSAALQLGILFDIFVWTIIATVFIRRLYRHFGSLDIDTMKHLKD